MMWECTLGDALFNSIQTEGLYKRRRMHARTPTCTHTCKTQIGKGKIIKRGMIHTHTHTHTKSNIIITKKTCVCARAHAHTHTHTHTHTNTHTRARAHTHTHTHIHIDTHTLLRAHAHTHTHTHTHTRTCTHHRLAKAKSSEEEWQIRRGHGSRFLLPPSHAAPSPRSHTTQLGSKTGKLSSAVREGAEGVYVGGGDSLLAACPKDEVTPRHDSPHHMPAELG